MGEYMGKKAGVQVLMYDITGQDPAYKKCVDNFLGQLDSAQYTPKGLIFVDNWGSNRHAGNNALLCAQLAEMGYQNAKCDKFVDTQIGYLLGDTGRSYMVGFGKNPPLRPHHRASPAAAPLLPPVVLPRRTAQQPTHRPSLVPLSEALTVMTTTMTPGTTTSPTRWPSTTMPASRVLLPTWPSMTAKHKCLFNLVLVQIQNHFTSFLFRPLIGINDS